MKTKIITPILVKGVQARCACGWIESGFHPFGGGKQGSKRMGLASYSDQADDARRSWKWHADNECPLTVKA